MAIKGVKSKPVKRKSALKEVRRKERMDRLQELQIGKKIVVTTIVILSIYSGWVYGIPYVQSLDIYGKVMPEIEIETIRVEGISLLDTNEIKLAIPVDTGTSVFSTDLELIAEEVARLASVERAEVKLTFRRELVVKVKERVPFAFAIQDGELFFMDVSGYLWPFKPGKYWSIPVVVGAKDFVDDDGNRQIAVESLERFSGIYSALRESEKSGVNRAITFDLAKSDYITVQLNGLEAVIRFSNDANNRVRNMVGILETLRKRDVKAVKYIDLSYRNVAFIR